MKVNKIEQVESYQPEVVDLKKPLGKDLVFAQRVSKDMDSFEYVAALLSQIGTFDGSAVPMEKVLEMSAKDLTELGNAVSSMIEGGGRTGAK